MRWNPFLAVNFLLKKSRVKLFLPESTVVALIYLMVFLYRLLYFLLADRSGVAQIDVEFIVFPN